MTGTDCSAQPADKKLRESERKYRQLLETLQEGVWAIDPEGYTTFVNPPMAAMLGYTVEEMLGKNLSLFMDAQGMELCRRYMERRQEGIGEQHEFEFLHKNGQRICALLETGPLTDENGAYCGAIAGVQDITERKQTEAALYQAVEESARSHRLLLTLSQVAQAVQRCSTPDEVYRVLGNEVARLGYHTAVFSLTEDRSSLRVAYVSLEYALVRQVEQAVELKMANVATPLAPGGCFAHVLAAGATTFQPPTAAFAAEALPAALCPQAESIVSRFGMDQPRIYAPLRAGEQIYGLLVVVGAGLTAADCPAVNVLANQAAVAIENGHLYDDLRQQLEQLVQTQAQLVHAAKLAAIGELAAGVAHEINNPLTGVLGFAEVLLGELPADFSHRHELGIIAAEARRVSRIVRNLLDFARQTHPHRQRVDLNELVRQPLALIGEQLRRSGVVIEENYASDLDPVCLDEGQIGQVLLNLFSNAAQSMLDGGRLTIRTARHNSMALIAVSDTGLGMPADVQERIFTPFFTTKPAGTGLGLSVSLGIVQEHGGRITVESKVGEGSTFTVWLPLEQPGETR